mgnify:CR=1 FL=1
MAQQRSRRDLSILAVLPSVPKDPRLCSVCRTRATLENFLLLTASMLIKLMASNAISVVCNGWISEVPCHFQQVL